MIDTPQITQVSAQPTAVIHVTVPRSQIREAMGPGYRELMDTVAAQGITPSGPWYTHHFRMDPEVFDFEIGVPVTAPFSATGRVQLGELPAATVAQAVYHGGYEGLPGGWAEFDEWIAAEGHATAPDLWERYLVGPESNADPATWRTELNRPLAR